MESLRNCSECGQVVLWNCKCVSLKHALIAEQWWVSKTTKSHALCSQCRFEWDPDEFQSPLPEIVIQKEQQGYLCCPAHRRKAQEWNNPGFPATAGPPKAPPKATPPPPKAAPVVGNNARLEGLVEGLSAALLDIRASIAEIDRRLTSLEDAQPAGEPSPGASMAGR